jgi:hypothetical protein
MNRHLCTPAVWLAGLAVLAAVTTGCASASAGAQHVTSDTSPSASGNPASARLVGLWLANYAKCPGRSSVDATPDSYTALSFDRSGHMVEYLNGSRMLSTYGSTRRTLHVSPRSGTASFDVGGPQNERISEELGHMYAEQQADYSADADSLVIHVDNCALEFRRIVSLPTVAMPSPIVGPSTPGALPSPGALTPSRLIHSRHPRAPKMTPSRH